MKSKMTESQMRAKAEQLSRKLYAIDQRRREKENSKLIGKCFKYRNSFSSPSKGWWLYARIVGVDGHYCKAFDFQKKEDGTFEIRPESTFTITEGWKEISREMFDAEWNCFMADLASTANL